jgi:hypothetical protein
MDEVAKITNQVDYEGAKEEDTSQHTRTFVLMRSTQRNNPNGKVEYEHINVLYWSLLSIFFRGSIVFLDHPPTTPLNVRTWKLEYWIQSSKAHLLSNYQQK